MPSLFGREKKKEELIMRLPEIYVILQREHHISPGDFPNVSKMQVLDITEQLVAHERFGLKSEGTLTNQKQQTLQLLAAGGCSPSSLSLHWKIEAGGCLRGSSSPLRRHVTKAHTQTLGSSVRQLRGQRSAEDAVSSCRGSV